MVRCCLSEFGMFKHQGLREWRKQSHIDWAAHWLSQWLSEWVLRCCVEEVYCNFVAQCTFAHVRTYVALPTFFSLPSFSISLCSGSLVHGFLNCWLAAWRAGKLAGGRLSSIAQARYSSTVLKRCAPKGSNFLPGDEKRGRRFELKPQAWLEFS